MHYSWLLEITPHFIDSSVWLELLQWRGAAGWSGDCDNSHASLVSLAGSSVAHLRPLWAPLEAGDLELNAFAQLDLLFNVWAS